MDDLKNVIQYLKDKYSLSNGFFCIYGSYATNTQNNNSDIDLLFIHRTNCSNLKRTSEKYNNIPISFYELSVKDLNDDANGKYGGFFCGKIFNPSIFVDSINEDENIIQKTIATYFGNLVNEKHCSLDKKYTADEILKNSICSYIELYPEYFSYILRLLENDNFINIWNKWKNEFTNILIHENIINKNNNKYIYNKVCSDEKFNRIKVDYISRFWIYGAISHNSDVGFYDYYKNKNMKYIVTHKKCQKKGEEFLKIKYTM